MSKIFLPGSILCVSLALTLAGCATTETSTSVATQAAPISSKPFAGKRLPVAIGKFENKSAFQRGIFSDGVDRMGSQARTILTAQLNLTNRFSVLDRENLDQATRESVMRAQPQALRGADFLVTGDVTEFGRKEVGDRQLFGLLGRGKAQIAYAKVTLNVVNTQTLEVAYSVQGAGEYALSAREVVGFGSTAGYDSTLNGKVLDLAIREAVDKLAAGVDAQAIK
ncbi:MAG: CsgG/HfaB family protein [Burkholderiaceae bacterium]